MSSLADKNLSPEAQDKINQITEQAKAGTYKGGWAAANEAANAIRASENANYTVSAGGTTGYNDGSTISSYKTGSQVSGGGAAQQTVSKYGGGSSGNTSPGNTPTTTPQNTQTYNGIQYTQQQGAGLYGAPVLNSDVKNYTQNGVNYRTGPSMARVTDPNIIQNGYYISNGYTVFVDQNGYAKMAVKGVADYTPTQDPNVKNGSYGSGGAWTDSNTLTADDQNAIEDIRAAMQRGEMTGDEANAAANAIRSRYGYIIDKSGNVTDLGALTRVNDRRQQMGLSVNPENGAAAYYRYLMNTDTSPAAEASGKVQSYQQFAQANGYDPGSPTGGAGVSLSPLPGNSVVSGTGGVAGAGQTVQNPGVSDVYNPGGMGDYLNQWYQDAQQQQQNTIDFGTNQAILELIRNQQDAAAKYQEQRDQIAVDEAKAKDNQALYAESRGDKGGIGAAQYDAIMNTAAQNRLAVNSAQTNLATDTSRQIADLRAQGEYEKADALLTLSQQYLSQLMSLEQWAAEYNLSVAEFNASLKQWQAEFDLKVADLLGSYNGQQTLSAKEFEFTQQQYADSLKADQEKKLANAGEILLAAGIMPSASQLAAMGMTETDAQSYLTAQKVAAATKKQSGGGGGGGGGNSTEKKPRLTAAQAQSAMNDENFTTSTLSAYDYYYGEGSALSALMNSNEWVAQLVRNLSTIKDENNGKARKYASLKQYYEKGYFNEAAYAYLLDYFGVA